MFGQRVAPGIMVFALGTGLGVPADATTILANYGTDRLRYTAPTWINDTNLPRHRGAREVRQGREVRARDLSLGHPSTRTGVTVCASQLKILTAKERAAYAGI